MCWRRIIYMRLCDKCKMIKIHKSLFIYYLVLVMSCYFCNASTQVLSKSTEVDLIIQGLDDEQWVGDEEQCIKDMFLILNNVKNHTLWAVWIWSANQHPVGTFYGSKYSLGNYDQCLQASSTIGNNIIRTQYCLAEVKLTDGEAKKRDEKPNLYGLTDDFLETKAIFGRIRNVINWGVCLPASCSVDSVSKVLKVIYSVNPYAAAKPDILVNNCEVEGDTVVYGEEYRVFQTIMISLMGIAVLSTCYLQNIKNGTLVSKITYSFNLRRNWSSLIKITGDEVAVLNFSKAQSLVITTCLHTFFFTIMVATSNSAYIDQAFGGKVDVYSRIINNVDLPSVENFFVISGLLVMKTLIRKKKNPLILLIQRYIRLVGSLAFLVFFSKTTLIYTGDGPIWKKIMSREQKACEDSWLWSILMLNNYVNNENICQVVTWYIPCDYQLTIMAVTLYSIWRWNKRTGIWVTIITAILAPLIPGLVTYWKGIPGVLIYDMEKFMDMRSNVVYLDTYMKSHNRAGSYLIGMAMGYILTQYSPAQYKGIISRRWSYIGFVVGVSSCNTVWIKAYSWCIENYNAWDSSVYAALSRNIWAIMFCLVIAVSEYGDAPRLQSMMAWPGYVILSRLSFGVYITHSLILQRISFSQRNPTNADFFDTIVKGLGVIMMSMLASLWLWLFVEAPLINLTNIILNPDKKKIENGITPEAKLNNHVEEIKNK